MDELEGRELDAKMAELMGWRWDDDWNCLIPPEQFAKPSDMWTIPNLGGYQEPVKENIVSGILYNANFTSVLLPHYSRDIAAAWLVVEKMRERGICIIIVPQKDDYLVTASEYLSQFNAYRHQHGLRADSFEKLPEAICLAARMAAEAE